MPGNMTMVWSLFLEKPGFCVVAGKTSSHAIPSFFSTANWYCLVCSTLLTPTAINLLIKQSSEEETIDSPCNGWLLFVKVLLLLPTFLLSLSLSHIPKTSVFFQKKCGVEFQLSMYSFTESILILQIMSNAHTFNLHLSVIRNIVLLDDRGWALSVKMFIPKYLILGYKYHWCYQCSTTVRFLSLPAWFQEIVLLLGFF